MNCSDADFFGARALALAARLATGSSRQRGPAAAAAEGKGDVSILRSPAFSAGLGQRPGCFKNKNLQPAKVVLLERRG